jgi:hypothetical protein
MKKYLFAGNFLLLFIGLVLLIWSLKPLPFVEESYNFNPDFSNIPDIGNCTFYNELKGSQFILNYPKVIKFQEFGELSLSVIKPIKESVNNQNNSPRTCELTIEVWIDIKNIIIEPGARSYQAFLDSQPQRFIFNIKSLINQPISGNVWIFANITDQKNNSIDRIPLFAIPLTIRNESFLGFSPDAVRNFSLFLILISILYLMVFNKMK